MSPASEHGELTEVDRRLTREFPQFPPDEIATMVREVHGRFETSKIRDFIPLLVETQESRLLTGKLAERTGRERLATT
jgi:hypothetical protein